MPIDNDFIAEQFDLLSKIMDIHGENSFKTRSYSSAAFALEKLPQQIRGIPAEKITSIKGIGDAIGKKIQEILHTGELGLLREYIHKTPPGIIEMLRIKGTGPKKISTIWKEMEIESIGELLYACQENRLMLYKGFGQKTQTNVQESIEFFFKSQGSHLYADVEVYARNLQTRLEEKFRDAETALTGAFRRQLEIIDSLQWVTTIIPGILQSWLESNEFILQPAETAIDANLAKTNDANLAQYKSPEGILLEFHHTTPELFTETLMQTSCSGEFLVAWQEKTKSKPDASPAIHYKTEAEIFAAANIHFIPPFLREQTKTIEMAAHGPLPTFIQPEDIKSIIHSHSNWSDGSNTLEEMALACIDQGYEYMVISDHSKSAGYANGLKEDRIKEQHILIDELNRKLVPFVIFKSIECDILTDGALDYSDNILSTFDLVIASVHSNLKMSEEKAMMRLLRAIENPYTTILGHMTGRLLLSRPGYPVDHKKVIEACALHQVVLELNAHPRRLDIDWRWIGLALQQGVLISVDPDAHSTTGYHHVRHGVLAGQKAGLTADRNLSSFTLKQFQDFLAARKKAKGI